MCLHTGLQAYQGVIEGRYSPTPGVARASNGTVLIMGSEALGKGITIGAWAHRLREAHSPPPHPCYTALSLYPSVHGKGLFSLDIPSTNLRVGEELVRLVTHSYSTLCEPT